MGTTWLSRGCLIRTLHIIRVMHGNGIGVPKP